MEYGAGSLSRLSCFFFGLALGKAIIKHAIIENVTGKAVMLEHVIIEINTGSERR